MKKVVAVLLIIWAAFGVAFGAQNSKVMLHIEGMTCGSCATAVRHVLKEIDGVKDVRVSYQQKQGLVTYDPMKVTPEKIAHAIEVKLPTYKATVMK
ncbi:MAG TPA: heavy metal-associated domain-containing protein [Thermoanaerobaculia bacterium]|nr:heavy metal-associated domain-containing protein [Thermoanaerobaculia bacterium]